MTDPTPAEASKAGAPVCPFCGSTRLADYYGRRAYVHCIECRANGPEADTADDARALFAKRPPPDAGEVRTYRDGVDRVREHLRVTMLAQPITGKRETYSDGFAQGISYAIGKMDALDPPPAAIRKLP